MKRNMLMLFLVLISFTMYSQEKGATIKLGYYNPGVSDGGFIIGGQWVKEIDENLGMGISIDWFKKNYIDQKLANEYKNSSTLGSDYELKATTNLYSFPAQYFVNVKVLDREKYDVYLTAGLGLDFLFINYKSYQTPIKDEMKAAVDFSWRVGTGIVVPLGSKSDIIGEIAYHSSNPSWNYEVIDGVTKKTFERSYDMSGLMFRMGIKFYY